MSFEKFVKVYPEVKSLSEEEQREKYLEYIDDMAEAMSEE